MSVEFTELVVHATTKVYFAKVNDAKFSTERNLSDSILVIYNFEVNNLNIFPEIIDNQLIKDLLPERFVLYFENRNLVIEANEKNKVEMLRFYLKNLDERYFFWTICLCQYGILLDLWWSCQVCLLVQFTV